MRYRTVMVNLTLNAANGSCLTVARDLADRLEAHVLGVAASEFSPPLYFTSGGAAQQLITDGEAAVEAGLAKLEEEFRAAMAGRSASIEWRCSRELPARYIARQARAVDIIVVGQSRGGPLTDSFALADPSDLIMQAGRPMLVVPETVRWLDLRSCMVAWKDTAESRRAIVDALPLLCRAEEVTVVEVVEGDTDESSARKRVQDVIAWLARHGVAAFDLVVAQDVNVASQLSQTASDIGAGIVVAGAYGHSRFREWVLGGVTRQLLQEADRCSLLSR